MNDTVLEILRTGIPDIVTTNYSKVLVRLLRTRRIHRTISITPVDGPGDRWAVREVD